MIGFQVKYYNLYVLLFLEPRITRFLSKLTNENERTHLTCHSVGDPKPITIFYKDGKNLTDNTDSYLIQGQKLIIKKPRFPYHDGLYKCYVKNIFGEATSEARLTVIGRGLLCLLK